jgi:hypothetical protein
MDQNSFSKNDWFFLKNRPIIRSNRLNFGFKIFSHSSRGSTSFRPNFSNFRRFFLNSWKCDGFASVRIITLRRILKHCTRRLLCNIKPILQKLLRLHKKDCFGSRSSSSSYGQAKIIDTRQLPCQRDGGCNNLAEGSDEHRRSAGPRPARGCGGGPWGGERQWMWGPTWRGLGMEGGQGWRLTAQCGGGRTRTMLDGLTWRGEDKDDAWWLSVEGA